MTFAFPTDPPTASLVIPPAGTDVQPLEMDNAWTLEFLGADAATLDSDGTVLTVNSPSAFGGSVFYEGDAGTGWPTFPKSLVAMRLVVTWPATTDGAQLQFSSLGNPSFALNAAPSSAAVSASLGSDSEFVTLSSIPAGESVEVRFLVSDGGDFQSHFAVDTSAGTTEFELDTPDEMPSFETWSLFLQVADTFGSFDIASLDVWLVEEPAAAGMWGLRQRQSLAGNAGGWPLRQRQNGGYMGGWPLRQRQIGL